VSPEPNNRTALSEEMTGNVESAGSSTAPRGGHWIEEWQPESGSFWSGTGRRIATKNLIFSIFAEHLAFTMWSLWSVLVVSLPAAGFHFSVNQLFWLVSMPNLLGSALRLPYTFAVPRFGGRNWTIVSTLLLLIPCAMLIVAVENKASYGFFLLAAATAGVGGGNFASSMANISFFYPDAQKGSALGFNAAGGNLGVAIGQLLVPIIIKIGTGVHLVYAVAFYAPLIVIAAACAIFLMDNLRAATSDFGAQAAAARRSDTWVMSFLYIGTFGSFIGYSFALPLLIKTQFPTVHGSYYAWMGALVGSLARPFGGWLSDKVGGSRVTLWNFVLMAAAAVLVVIGERNDSFPMFFGFFLVLFVTSGIGNGSTYRMIPAIWARRAARLAAAGGDLEAEQRQGRREAAAAIGIASSIGAFGGFGVTRAFATSINHTKVADAAFYGFIAFYALCFVVTWAVYLRGGSEPTSSERAPARELARV
jgi:MFS transporter, NNP family, nitrate/nitrite transporter